jgi:hypothetical protein
MESFQPLLNRQRWPTSRLELLTAFIVLNDSVSHSVELGGGVKGKFKGKVVPVL